MATTCSCGCGRTISGLRLRAANSVAAEMGAQLATLGGALAHGDDDGSVAALVDEGEAQLATMTRYLHGELARRDLDKGAATDWLGRARARSKALVRGADGPAWLPADPRTDRLALSGTRTTGVITDVRRDGWGNERNADLEITVTIVGPDGGRLDVERKLSIAVVAAPRTGDRVEVAYDPDDPDRFVYRPLLDLPEPSA